MEADQPASGSWGKRHKQELKFPLRLSPEGGPLVTPEEDVNDLQKHFGETEKAAQSTKEEMFQQYIRRGSVLADT
eukprot:854047-Pyramimonas_sp.AAC.1